MKDIQIGKMVITQDFLFFLIATALLGVTQAVESTSFANRLAEDLGFTTRQRTLLEFPRELPGLLIVFVIGMLSFLGDIRSAAVGNIFGGSGLLAFGFVPSGFWAVVITMMLYSLGQHVYFPLQSAISMTFARDGNLGRRLGEIQSVNTAMLIITAAVLYVLYSFVGIPFKVAFTMGAIAMIAAGVMFLMMNPGPPKTKKSRFVIKKKYTLFYLVAVFFGSRRQITMTFVVWLIVTIYEQPASTIVILFFITNVIGVFFRPYIGMHIDRHGERATLILEGTLLTLSCFGLAFAKVLFSRPVALIVVSACYVIDNLFSVGAQMSRTTYIKKLVDSQDEVSGALAFGLSLDHILSMTMPIIAGVVWDWNADTGYIYVFLGGVVLSLICVALSTRVRIPERQAVSS